MKIKMSALSRTQYEQIKSAYRDNPASNADEISIAYLGSIVNILLFLKYKSTIYRLYKFFKIFCIKCLTKGNLFAII